MGTLKPTHVQYSSGDKGKSYAKLKPGTSWSQAKKTAEHLSATSGKPAKPVRRK